MSNKKWYLVEFEDGIQVVPDNWVVENMSYWPTFTGPNSSQLYKRAVVNHKQPEDEWPIYSIKILGVYDKYEKSLEKLRLAEIQSDINSETESKKQRAVRKKKIVSDSEETDNDDENFGPIKPFPVLNCSKKYITKAKPSTSVNVNIEESLNNEIQEIEQTNNVGETLDEEFKSRVLKDLAFLKNKMAVLIKLVEHLDLSGSKKEKLEAVEDDYLMTDFPINTVDKLNNIEMLIEQSPEYKQKLILHLTRVGGYKVDEVVKTVLKKLFTDKLMCNYNWEGKKGKSTFSSLHLAGIILHAVKESSNLKLVTEKEIINSIKNWLRHATARNMNKELSIFI